MNNSAMDMIVRHASKPVSATVMHATKGKEPPPTPKPEREVTARPDFDEGTSEGCGAHHHLSKLTPPSRQTG